MGMAGRTVLVTRPAPTIDVMGLSVPALVLKVLRGMGPIGGHN